MLRRPDVSYDSLDIKAENVADAVWQQIEIQQKYGGYIKRQETEIARLRRYEETKIPIDIDYNKIKGFSNEVSQKLQKQRPNTIGQASRIPGITPAAISLLLVHLKSKNG